MLVIDCLNIRKIKIPSSGTPRCCRHDAESNKMLKWPREFRLKMFRPVEHVMPFFFRSNITEQRVQTELEDKEV